MALETRLANAVTSSVCVAQHPQAAGCVGADLDISVVSGHLVARNRLGDNGIDVDLGHVGQPLGALQPGQLDQLGDHVPQSVGLDEHLLGEPANGFGVIRRSQQGLGEQSHGTNRGLELVADVGHEVAPGRLHARVFGLVVDEDHGEPAVFLAQQPGLPVHR